MPTSEVCDLLEAKGLAYSLIYSAGDILDNPHYAARGGILTLDNPRIGQLKMPRLSATPAPVPRLAPELGAQTDEILESSLGMTREQISALRSQRVI